MIAATHEKINLLQHPTFDLLSPQFSPDNRWIALHVRNSELTRRLVIVPFRKDLPPKESEWIPVTDGQGLDREPQWSPDGRMLYFLSDRDGFRCIWAQRLEPESKRALGAMFAIRHFHSARRSLNVFVNSGMAGPSVAADKIVFGLGDRSGNIWMTKLEEQK
jgi:dipeptidyl aminopeptidase/acylaminoacyl peptidase